jgi:VanZ family protein
MILIFYMSSAVEDESKAQSGIICGFLCETFVEGYERMEPAQQLQMQERFSFPVRKGAHLTEYMILGALLTLTTASYRADDVGFFWSAHTAANRASETTTDRQFVTERFGSFETAPAGISCAWLIPLLIGFLYAVSDEIHQYFVPGRAMQARDVLIDTSGVLLGIWIARGIMRIRYGERRKSTR